MRRIHAALAALATTSAACVTAPQLPTSAQLAQAIELAPSGAGAADVSPRPPACAVPFFRTRPPERTYDEIAVLHLDWFGELGAAAVQEALRARACALGADAAVVTREFEKGRYTSMSVAALSYPELRAQHRAEWKEYQEETARARAQEEAALARARAEAERVRAEAIAKGEAARAEFTGGAKYAAAAPAPGPVAGVPAGYVPAKATCYFLVRALPQRTAADRGAVEEGAVVWAAPAAKNGWRRIWAAGVTGYAEETDLAPAPVPAAAAPAR